MCVFCLFVFVRETEEHFVTEQYLPTDGLVPSTSGSMIWHDMGVPVV